NRCQLDGLGTGVTRIMLQSRLHDEAVAGFELQDWLPIDQQFPLAFHDVSDLIAGMRMASGVRPWRDLDRRDSGFSARDRYFAGINHCALYSWVLGQQAAACRDKAGGYETRG